MPARDRGRWIEQVCDYFAGCLLMPRGWLKRAYGGGTQDVAALAARFEVSQAAMQVRLNQIGLTPSLPRCSRPYYRLALRGDSWTGTPAVRQRMPRPLAGLGEVT